MTDHPAPLEFFQQPKLHEDNLKLIEERERWFRELERRERRELEREQRRLWKLLNRAHYNELCERQAEHVEAALEAKQQWQQLEAEINQLVQSESGDAAHIRALKLERRHCKETARAQHKSALEIHRVLPLLALAVHDFDQFHRFLLHFDQETIDLCPEVAVEDHARNGDDQAKTGVVKRHRDAVSQLQWIGSGR